MLNPALTEAKRKAWRALCNALKMFTGVYVYKYIINVSEKFILRAMENSNIRRKQS